MAHRCRSAMFCSSVTNRRKAEVPVTFPKRRDGPRADLAPHASLMPANLITLAHFLGFVGISLRKSSGEPPRIIERDQSDAIDPNQKPTAAQTPDLPQAHRIQRLANDPL